MKNCKVFLSSIHLDCKPHSVLSAQIYHYLISNNHQLVSEATSADYVIINTCGFINWYEVSSELAIIRYSKLKNDPKIIVLGCLPKINSSRLSKYENIIVVENLEELDNFFFVKEKLSKKNMFFTKEMIGCFNPERMHNDVIVNLIERINKKVVNLLKYTGLSSFPLNKIVEEDDREKKFYVKIGSGCIGNCSYCIIKKAKDKIISRKIIDIIADIKDNIQYIQHENIVLVADDCTTYGIDIGTNLNALLREIGREFPNKGIDITYAYPQLIVKNSEDFLDVVKNVKINSINISMQSGSEKILKLMNRRYDVRKVIKVIQSINKISPGTLIWTHFLFGFPGETTKDFLKTLSIIPFFHYCFVFRYSERIGTQSIELPNKVPFLLKELRKNFAKLYMYLNVAKSIIKNIFFLIRVRKNN